MSGSMALEGATDAVGFMVGALAGFGLGQMLGFDLLAPGYDLHSVIGILLVGLGGGGGLQLARALRRRLARRRRNLADSAPD